MNQSRLMWVLGGATGLLLIFAGLAVRLAVMPHQLHVRVSDAQGPLAGVWVTLDEGDVQITDAAGFVRIQGRRYELDNSVLTVADPSTRQWHLSRTLRTEISWKPWRSLTRLDVLLPTVEGAARIASGMSDEIPEIDLPLVQSTNPDGSRGQASVAAQGSDQPFLREEALEDSGEQKTLPATEMGAQEVGFKPIWPHLLCGWSGFTDGFCAADSAAVSPPLISESVKGPLGGFELIASGWSKPSEAAHETPSVLRNMSEERPEKSKVAPEKLKQSVFSLQVSFAGKPLSNARIYMSRLKGNRVRELGSSSGEGLLQVKIPREFLGESFSVFHSCCVPKTFALNPSAQSETSSLKVELQSGTGNAVLVQQEAYGLLRKVDHFELFSSNRKLAVSAADGFAIYNNSKTPELTASKLQVRGARPAEFLISQDDASHSAPQPLTYLVSSEQTYVPALAIVERSAGRSFQGVLRQSDLRRWRRDFFARLMQLQSVRSIVSSEAEARIAAAGESLPSVISRGWSETHLSGEWDFLLAVNYDENSGEVKLSAIDASGREYFEKKIQLSGGGPLPPESVARRTFDAFVESIPFEGSVLSQQDQEITLSFSGEKIFGLRTEMPLAIYQQSAAAGESQRLTELAALAVVVGSDKQKNIRARITHWNSNVRKTEMLPDVVRVVKISPSEYQKEVLRRGIFRSSISRSTLNKSKPL